MNTLPLQIPSPTSSVTMEEQLTLSGYYAILNALQTMESTKSADYLFLILKYSNESAKSILYTNRNLYEALIERLTANDRETVNRHFECYQRTNNSIGKDSEPCFYDGCLI